MFRGAVIALLSILCLGLTITAVASWRTQARMAEQMTALTEQLKSLAEKQVAAPPPAPVVATPSVEPKPLTIDGVVFDGVPSKPVANAEVRVVDMKDGREIRTVTSDAAGNFSSGPLAGGDYCVIPQAPGRNEQGRPTGRSVQYAPVSAYPGVAVPRQQLDISMHAGGIAIETSRPLPLQTIGERYVIDTRLLVGVVSPRERPNIWVQGESGHPGGWPVFTISGRLNGAGGPAGSRDGRETIDLLSREELTSHLAGTAFQQLRPPAGKIKVGAVVLADIWPVGYVTPPRPKREAGRRGGGASKAAWDAAAWDMVEQNMSLSGPLLSSFPSVGRGGTLPETDDFRWLTKGLGKTWLSHLQQEPADKLPPPYLIQATAYRKFGTQNVEIVEGQATRICLEIPEDLESQIEKLVAETTDPAQFAKFTVGILPNRGRTMTDAEASPFLRAAPLTVVGTQPLAEPAKSPMP